MGMLQMEESLTSSSGHGGFGWFADEVEGEKEESGAPVTRCRQQQRARQMAWPVVGMLRSSSMSWSRRRPRCSSRTPEFLVAALCFLSLAALRLALRWRAEGGPRRHGDGGVRSSARRAEQQEVRLRGDRRPHHLRAGRAAQALPLPAPQRSSRASPGGAGSFCSLSVRPKLAAGCFIRPRFGHGVVA